MVIGAGSLSFELMKLLTDRLPVMLCPRWLTTPTQPIAVDDVLAYLLAALDLPPGEGRIFEVGGPDVSTYGDLIRVMRGSLALVPCASRFAHEKCKNCLEEGECRTRALMLQVRDRTAELLDSIRLSDPITLEPAQEYYDEAELGTGHG